jgi:hypothetical protein
MENLCDGIYKGKAIVYTGCFRAKKAPPSINIPFTSLLVDPNRQQAIQNHQRGQNPCQPASVTTAPIATAARAGAPPA